MLIYWIKFNQVTTPSHKAAYVNQKELLLSKSLGLEVVSSISKSEIVRSKFPLLNTLWNIPESPDFSCVIECNQGFVPKTMVFAFKTKDFMGLILNTPIKF